MASKTTYELQLKLGALTSSSWKTTLNKAQKDLEGFDNFNSKLMTGIAAGTTAVATAAVYAASQAKDVYEEFEQEMATVKSISGANAAQFLEMKEAALDAGQSTIFTATESASALEYMSLAGWDAQESMTGLVPILKLAAATQKELQTTSDLVTDSMSALKVDISDLNPYLDKLAVTNNKANTTAEELMQSLLKAGGASRTLGASLDDTITASGILANNGRKGEEAGTALNAIFVRLAGNAQTLKELSKLNISIWNNDGTFVGFEEALTRINNALSSLTDEQKAASLKEIAGTHHYSDLAYLLDAVTANAETGKTAWNELEGYIENSSGALDTMYATTTDTLETAEKLLNSAIQDAQIRVTDVFSDDAKDFVNWIAGEVPKATDALTEFGEAHKGDFADGLQAVGEGIETIWDYGVTAGEWLLDNKKALIGGLEGIAASFVAVKVATAGIKIAKYFTNPVSIALTAAELGAVAIGALAGAAQDAQDALVNADLEGHFGDITLSMKDMENVAKKITGSDALGGISTALKTFDSLDGFTENMEDATASIEKANWKVSIGMELTSDEQDSYKSEIDKYIKNAEEYVQQSGYAVKINLEADGGDDNYKIAAINDKINAFYENSYSEMTSLGEQLSTAVNEAFSDNILDPDEIADISEIQSKMAELQQSMATSEFNASLTALGTKYGIGGELTPESYMQLMGEIDDQVSTATDSYFEAYKKELAATEAAHSAGDLTDAEYNAKRMDAENQYINNVADLQTKGVGFGLDTITEQYGNDISAYADKITEKSSKRLEGLLNMSPEQLSLYDYDQLQDYYYDMFKTVTEDESFQVTRDAIEKLLESQQESIDRLKETRDKLAAEGKTVPESITQSIDQADYLQGIADGDMDAIYSMLGQSLGDQGLYKKLINAADNGRTVPSAMLDAAGDADTDRIKKIQDTVSNEVQSLYEFSQSEIDSRFAEGFVIDTDARMTINPIYQFTDGNTKQSAKSSLYVYKNAEGGIYDEPILTTFAEEGAESAIPIDGSDRAKSLWVKTGDMLGMFSSENRDSAMLEKTASRQSGSTSNFQISFTPAITIKGNASKEEIQQGISLSLLDLKAMIKEIQAEEARTSFR